MAANRYSVVFVGALVVAGAVTYAVFRTVQQSRESSRIVTVPVVVAAKDIAEGTPIDRLALTTAQWPAPTVPVGAFASIDSVAGRIARVAIFSGEPLVPGRLAPMGTGPGLEVMLSPGKRAMAIRINDVMSLAGMIQPNSRVDIFLTLNKDDGPRGRSAKLFMSNMRVLAMGSTAQRADDGRPIVTTVASLEVTPEEAEKLLVAQTQGQIQLALRGYGDPDSVVTTGASAADVTGSLRDVPMPAPPRPRTRSAPAPAPIAATPAPPPAKVEVAAPARPESSSVRIWRGRQAEEKRFAKDSVKPDTVR